MTLYIRPNGEKVVDPGQLPGGEVRKLRRAARAGRGTRRGRGPLSATQSQDLTPPRGRDSTASATRGA